MSIVSSFIRIFYWFTAIPHYLQWTHVANGKIRIRIKFLRPYVCAINFMSRQLRLNALVIVFAFAFAHIAEYERISEIADLQSNSHSYHSLNSINSIHSKHKLIIISELYLYIRVASSVSNHLTSSDAFRRDRRLSNVSQLAHTVRN